MVWSIDQSQRWYASQGDWKQGMNYIPSYASNQIEHWQDYNETHIRQELEWAAALNYNAVRVFLHDQLFTYEGDAFIDKVQSFLALADNLGFSTILVLLEGENHSDDDDEQHGQHDNYYQNEMLISCHQSH